MICSEGSAGYAFIEMEQACIITKKQLRHSNYVFESLTH